MDGMTTTSAPFREADVIRDTAGKFSGKDQSAPELTLGDADFDIRDFMQEPPTVAAPFTTLQPVVYRDVDGSDFHATIVGFEDHGYVRIAERTPGTFGDYDDDDRVVESRYLREDTDISLDTAARQQRGLDSSTQVALDITKATNAARSGLDSYDDALHVRDQLKVDGRTDWHDSHVAGIRAVDAAISDLEHNDLLTRTAVSWTSLDGSGDAPPEFTKADEVIGWDNATHISSVLQAKLVEQYEDAVSIGDGHIERVNASLADAFDLGTRMNAAVLAADEVDADADAIGEERAAAIFPGVVDGLSQRKKLAYRKAVGAASEAFETLERYGLLDSKHRAYGRSAAKPDGESMILTRAAAQAAILRHYQPETGLADAQLDAISVVWDGAVAAHAKAAA